MAGLILERAPVPVAPFFPGGHTENLLTVPAWHTDCFSHSNFHFLEKKSFFHHLNSICLEKIIFVFEFSHIHLDNEMLIKMAFLVYWGKFL
jgi:hypothetical protein